MSFFFAEAVESHGKKTIPLHTARELGCRVCPLKTSGALNPDMPPDGSKEPIFYFLGEGPGENEDKQNRPFVGKSGQLLRACIPADIEEISRFNNVVRTRPPDNRKPEEIEIECCRNSIIADIEKSAPLVIIPVGAVALHWLINESDIAKWRGRFFPVKVGNHICWTYPIYHPAYILRNSRTDKNGKPLRNEWDHIFELDLKNLFDQFEHLQHPPIYIETGYLNQVAWTEGLKSDRELDKVLNWLDYMAKADLVGFDYETNCLRPFEKNAAIITLALADTKKAVAFPIDYPNAWTEKQLTTLKAALIKFFKSQAHKVCHNAKFEMEWTGSVFGTEFLHTSTWEDTQAQAYVLDERRGMLNLDSLIRINFGFWLKNLSNIDRKRMLDYPLEKILPYNALDAKWTLRLFICQDAKLEKEPKLKTVYQKLLETAATLAATQIRGVCFDYNQHAELNKQFQSELDSVVDQISRLPEVEQFKNKFGLTFKPGSPDHILRCFKTILNVDEQLKKENGKYSTDEATLSTLKDDFELAKLILNYRHVAKKISTYIEPYPGYVMPKDGRIHTNYNPYDTSTGRLCVAKGTFIEVVRDYSKDPLGIRVEDVKEGDYVYTYNDDLNVTLKKVTWSGKTGTKQVMRIHWIGDGHKTEGYLDVTYNHPIRLINGEYKPAEKLKVGDRVLSMTRTVKSGRSFPNNHKIVKIEWLSDFVDVYDLGVEDTHNFIANGLCISNSSSDPNLQNVPNKTGKELRRMICAPENYWMVCSDYGQIEARIIGVASQDEEFCKALWEDYDVHMHWAEAIANEYPKVIKGSQNLNDKAVMKKFRAAVKNLWVFPAFYGASPHSIAKGIGVPIEIVLDIFRDFWQTFRGVKQWQKWILNRYEKLGYVETLSGRRRHAPMTANAVLNASIQGFASDICVDAMCRLDRLGIETALQIHDDVTAYVKDEELEKTIQKIAREMCNCTNYPWINVPIVIEMSAGPNWFDQEPIGVYKSTDFYKVPRKLQDFTKLYDV